MGKAPYEKVMTLMPEVWTDVEISIDTLIAEYDTYLGAKASLYLIYLDNEIIKALRNISITISATLRWRNAEN